MSIRAQLSEELKTAMRAKDTVLLDAPTQLEGYPPDFYERPLARAYRARNPDFRSNGCYLAFASDISPDNLAAMRAAVARRQHG